jgi:hypothetical protein
VAKNRDKFKRGPSTPWTPKTAANRSLPSDTQSEQPREFTYRIGRRQGVIRADGNRHAPARVGDRKPEPVRESDRKPEPVTSKPSIPSSKPVEPDKPRVNVRFDLWRAAPNMSLKYWLLCLYALPVVTAFAVLWLILALQG